MIPSGSNGRRTAWDLEFDERGVKRTQEDQAMNPIVGTHTKENMSAAKEEKQEDTMCKETNCIITPFVQLNPWFDQNSVRQTPILN